MRRYAVGKPEEFTEDGGSDTSRVQAKIVHVQGIEVGIYRLNGRFYAYENSCAHQGGPACEGSLFADVGWKADSKVSPVTPLDSKDQFNIACPWHGVEYDLVTGIGRADRRMRLRPFKVR